MELQLLAPIILSRDVSLRFPPMKLGCLLIPNPMSSVLPVLSLNRAVEVA